MPKISIIVPVYKVEPYIHRCVDSILNQSCTDFELILVDDGSPDRCGAICDEYAEKDSRIHVIHQENGGLSAARNAGIDWSVLNSDSQWLTFIDSDDWIHRDYLQIMMLAVGEDVDIAMCELLRTDRIIQDRPMEVTPKYMESQSAYIDHYGMCMTACCKLYRKILFSQVRFPVGKLHEDCYITHIPLFAAKNVAVCNIPLYYYYFNPNSITRARWNPKRLEELDAHEQRLDYLLERGYKSAYKRELEVYGDTLMEQAEVLRKLQKEDVCCKHYLAELKKKLCHVLEKEKEIGTLEFNQGRIWIYLMAYPTGPLYSIARLMQQIRHGR